MQEIIQDMIYNQWHFSNRIDLDWKIFDICSRTQIYEKLLKTKDKIIFRHDINEKDCIFLEIYFKPSTSRYFIRYYSNESYSKKNFVFLEFNY